MKKTIISLLLVAAIATSCKKTSETPWVAPDASNPFEPTTGYDVKVSMNLYPYNGYGWQNLWNWWSKIHLSSKYGINTSGKIYFRFQNSFYNTPNSFKVNIPLPVVSRDTAVDTYQVYSTGATATNLIIDSIVCADKNYRFSW